jgi:membrane associated rhomboid family serine protease
MPPLSRLNTILLWVLTGGLLLTFVGGDAVVRFFALWPFGGDDFQRAGTFLPWQLVTYVFVNGSLFNLLFAGLALWMIGGLLEQVWGQARYLNYLLACALGAGVGQLAVMSFGLFGAGAAVATGPAGVVYGLLLGLAVVFPNMRVMLLIPPIPVRAQTMVIVLGVILLVLGYLDPSQRGLVLGTLGGPLAGWLMIRYWQGKPPFNRRGPRLVR